MILTDAQLDRAIGAVLASAAGDALGAGYEFGPPLPVTTPVELKGGGGFGWEPGEWTDDTSMAVPILKAAARGDRFDDAAVLGRIVGEWIGWSKGSKDVGIHEATGRSAGNGSLMRTGPLALAFLDDEPGLIAAARRVSDLTHYEQDAGDACVIWCVSIRHAILTGELDIDGGIAALDATRRERWTALLHDAETTPLAEFTQNGWVVQAIQAAWGAVVQGGSLVGALECAVRGGRDTDTVAAIAGALAGARWGASAVPTSWGGLLHGWPDLTGDDLAGLAERAVSVPRV